MPSYKPRITVYTDEKTNQKLAYIAKTQNRSASNYTEWLIKQAISDYENEHGEIKTEEPESVKELKEWAKRATDKSIPVTERMKDSFMTGFNAVAGKKPDEE